MSVSAQAVGSLAKAAAFGGCLDVLERCAASIVMVLVRRHLFGGSQFGFPRVVVPIDPAAH
eukprot:6813042-Heterocapsa_arctica.AAC.1